MILYSTTSVKRVLKYKFKKNITLDSLRNLYYTEQTNNLIRNKIHVTTLHTRQHIRKKYVYLNQ